MGKGYAAVALCSQPGDVPLLGWLFGSVAVLGRSFSRSSFRGEGNRDGRGAYCDCGPTVLLPCAALYVLLRLVGGKLRWTERLHRFVLGVRLLFALLCVARGTHRLGRVCVTGVRGMASQEVFRC